MCGIACVASAAPRQLAPLVREMTGLIKHRGPDDEGYAFFDGRRSWVCAGGATHAALQGSGLGWAPQCAVDGLEAHARVGLGHRRLAIVDTSPLGHQPMSYAEGRYWIIFNGEVYNHIELGIELDALGHRFKTHSDTEVILAAYAQWGHGCLDRFNGMWAMVIFDREAQTLFVARDRFGVKPLYYSVDEGGLIAFASEIKQFLAMPGWRARLNFQRAWDFLVWNVSDHTDETLFRGVHQVPAGHYMLLPLRAPVAESDPSGRIPSTRWYSLREEQYQGSFEEASDRLLELLADSVRVRLRADVPVGSCLSGGLDSSALTCLMHQQSGMGRSGNRWAFSACSDVGLVDESAWIDRVVQHTGVSSRRVIPEVEGLFAELPELAWVQDEPFGSSSIYAQWCVFRLAGETGVKVILDGQGADEQLAGYHGFMAPALLQNLRRAQLCDFVAELRALHWRLGYSYPHIGQRLGDLVLPEWLRQPLRRWAGRTSSASNAWLENRLFERQGIDRNAGAPHRHGSVRSLSRDLVSSRHLPMLLRWEDRNSMAHGVESRVPFLDYRLVEFSLSLPDEFKLRRGLTKRVLRSAMKGILPEAVRRRTDKIGFATPEQVWFLQRAPDAFRSALSDAAEQSRGVLRPQAVGHFDECAANMPAAKLSECWRMISFGQWMERFSVQAT